MRQTQQELPTEGRRDRRRERTRLALMTAAETLFAAHGVAGVSIDEIARGADVAKGTFYNHFADKEALAAEVSEAVRASLEADIALLNLDVTDAALRVARALCFVLQLGLRAPIRARTMMRMHAHAADPDAPLNAGVLADVRRGLSTRCFRAESEESAIVFVVGVVQAGLSRTLDGSGDDATRRLARALGTLLLAGLGLDRVEARRLMVAAAETVFGTERR
jgi:AcrR family transcriptional regulator